MSIFIRIIIESKLHSSEHLKKFLGQNNVSSWAVGDYKGNTTIARNKNGVQFEKEYSLDIDIDYAIDDFFKEINIESTKISGFGDSIEAFFNVLFTVMKSLHFLLAKKIFLKFHR